MCVCVCVCVCFTETQFCVKTDFQVHFNGEQLWMPYEVSPHIMFHTSLRHLVVQVKSLERLTQEQEEGLKTYQDKINHLENEVGKHTQIASLIHSLSSGQNLPPGVLPLNK